MRLACFAGSPRPTHGVDVTGFVAQGVASLQAHVAYLRGLGGGFDPAAFLGDQAAQGGRRLGVAQAALFEVFEL